MSQIFRSLLRVADIVRNRGRPRTDSAVAWQRALADLAQDTTVAPTPQALERLMGRLAAAAPVPRLEVLTWDEGVRSGHRRQQAWTSDPSHPKPLPGAPLAQDLLLVDDRGEPVGFARAEVAALPGRRVQELTSALGLLLDRQLAHRVVTDLREQALRAYADLTDQRQRTAAAMDRSRRELEHDLHDGVQGDLVALGLRLRLRSTLGGTDLPPDVSLPEPVDLLREAEALRDRIVAAASGLMPTQLLEGGLPAALRHELPADAGGRLEVALTDDLSDRRFPTEVEATVYFICAEAVVNARKHAPGSDIRVDVWSSYRGVELLVADTGPGFDGPPTVGSFRALRARAAAAGGELTISSSVARGTRVRATIPC